MSDLILVLATVLEEIVIERDLAKFLGQEPTADSKVTFHCDMETVWDVIDEVGTLARKGQSVQVLYTGYMNSRGKKGPVSVNEELLLRSLQENNLSNYKKIKDPAEF